MTSKPNYLDLLAKRVTGNTRRMARIQVYLDPDAITALDEARQELGAERVNASAHPDTPVKISVKIRYPSSDTSHLQGHKM